MTEMQMLAILWLFCTFIIAGYLMGLREAMEVYGFIISLTLTVAAIVYLIVTLT